MKQIISKIASTLLALLVLFSTFSFTVEKHYCGDFLVDVSFTGEVDSCADNLSQNVEKVRKSCCTDEIHQIEGQDKLRQSQVDEFDFSKQLFLASFYISFNDLFLGKELKKINYKDISPPGIFYNYQVLYQSFLI